LTFSSIALPYTGGFAFPATITAMSAVELEIQECPRTSRALAPIPDIDPPSSRLISGANKTERKQVCRTIAHFPLSVILTKVGICAPASRHEQWAKAPSGG